MIFLSVLLEKSSIFDMKMDFIIDLLNIDQYIIENTYLKNKNLFEYYFYNESLYLIDNSMNKYSYLLNFYPSNNDDLLNNKKNLIYSVKYKDGKKVIE